MEISRSKIGSEEFKVTHRKKETAFTRRRVLTFEVMIVMMLRKSLKSLQLRINEAFLAMGLPLVSGSAYTQARRHLNYTAFIELNEAAIVEVVYEGEGYQRWKGHRLLAVDGSIMRLPGTASVAEVFGRESYTDGSGEQAAGTHVMGRMSVLYDVLNHIGLEAVLDPYRSYEGDQALAHLARTQAGDLLLMDRGYPSYYLLATILSLPGRAAVIRCSQGSFGPARQMLAGHGNDSQVVSLKVPSSQRQAVDEAGLPHSITVRFVRVMLDTGEVELLVTTLLDETHYPTHEFKALYHARWGIETFYDLVKNRLDLEHFTGQTALSVLQDFHATIYLTGLESILTQKAQHHLDDKHHLKNRQQVNRAVSFNALKHQVFDLLTSDLEIDPLLDQLTQLFLTSPTAVRPDRPASKNRKSSLSKALNYYKRRRKIVF